MTRCRDATHDEMPHTNEMPSCKHMNRCPVSPMPSFSNQPNRTPRMQRLLKIVCHPARCHKPLLHKPLLQVQAPLSRRWCVQGGERPKVGALNLVSASHRSCSVLQPIPHTCTVTPTTTPTTTPCHPPCGCACVSKRQYVGSMWLRYSWRTLILAWRRWLHIA